MTAKRSHFHLNGLPEYTDEAILAEIRRVALLIERDQLTPARFKRFSHVGMSTVRRHFRTWCDAVRAAGLEHRLGPTRGSSEKLRLQRGKGMSDQELTDIIRGIASELSSETLTMDEFNRHAPINPATACRRFGGWAKALARAGLAPSSVQRRYSDEDCFENLLTVWTYYGRAPKFHEMPMPPSTISTRAYVVRWGSWRKALRAFVNYMNSREDTPQVESTGNAPSANAVRQQPGSLQRIPEADSRNIKLRLRYKILLRDNFRCVLCGRSPATVPGLQLHVDHIHPWSQGGKTVPENLRTTCSECNLGKGDTIEKGE